MPPSSASEVYPKMCHVVLGVVWDTLRLRNASQENGGLRASLVIIPLKLSV